MSRPVAILLCAGYGTRMGELTARVPKPLLPVGGRPVLDHLLDRLGELEGLSEGWVVSNSRYFAAFESWAAERDGAPLRLRVFDDGSTSAENRRGAVGDLGFVLRAAGGRPESALVAAGDNVFRFSLRFFWERFRQGEAHRVVALPESDPGRLRRTGVLELSGQRVVRLWEKPAKPPSAWACPPVYALRRSALERVEPYLAAGRPSDEIGRFIAALTETERVEAERIAGERLDIGSPESYRRADEILTKEPVVSSKMTRNKP